MVIFLQTVYQFIRQIQSNYRREKTIFKQLGVIKDPLLTFKAQVFKNVNGVHFKHIRSDLTTKGSEVYMSVMVFLSDEVLSYQLDK